MSQIIYSLELYGAIVLTQSHSREVFRQTPSLLSAKAESDVGTISVT